MARFNNSDMFRALPSQWKERKWCETSSTIYRLYPHVSLSTLPAHSFWTRWCTSLTIPATRAVWTRRGDTNMRRPSKPCAALISVNYGSQSEACELAVRMLLCPGLPGHRVCVWWAIMINLCWHRGLLALQVAPYAAHLYPPRNFSKCLFLCAWCRLSV